MKTQTKKFVSDEDKLMQDKNIKWTSSTVMNNNDPFGFTKAINFDKLKDPEVLKALDSSPVLEVRPHWIFRQHQLQHH